MWLVQNNRRYRYASSFSDLDNNKIYNVFECFEHKCAYCSSNADSLEFAFKPSKGAPMVQANILTICSSCRLKKRNRDIIDFHRMGYLDADDLEKLFMYLCQLDGADHLKAYLFEVSQ